MTYISWFSDIGLYLEDYFMYKAVTLAGGIREPLLTLALVIDINFTSFPVFLSFFFFFFKVLFPSLFTYYLTQ